MIVYVDDVAMFGPEEVVSELVRVIGQKWTLSEPSWTCDRNQVVFCGMDLNQYPWGWRVSQVRYPTELLQRYGVEGTATSPMVRADEPEATGHYRGGFVGYDEVKAGLDVRYQSDESMGNEGPSAS